MKKTAVLLLLFCAGSFAAKSGGLAWGQSAGDLERIINAKEISCADAAYFALLSGLENPPANPQAAFAFALEKGWLPKKAESNSAATFGTISLLVMQVFEIKGGLMYRLFPNGRYAYREMINRGFIEGPSYSNLKVSGEQFLQILDSVLSYTGDTEI
jgi:hypothetical protein